MAGREFEDSFKGFLAPQPEKFFTLISVSCIADVIKVRIIIVNFCG